MRPDHKIGKCPALTMIWAHLRSTPAGQGSANDDSVQDRTGVRGASAQPLAHRVSMHLGALVLCRGASDRKLLSVLNSAGRRRWRPYRCTECASRLGSQLADELRL